MSDSVAQKSRKRMGQLIWRLLTIAGFWAAIIFVPEMHEAFWWKGVGAIVATATFLEALSRLVQSEIAERTTDEG